MTITDRCPLGECTLWPLYHRTQTFTTDDEGQWWLIVELRHQRHIEDIYFCPFCGIPLIE